MIGAAFGALGVSLLWRNVWMMLCGNATYAKVVAYQHRQSDGETYSVPVLEFREASGKLRQEVVDFGPEKTPAVGARVRVRFDPRGDRQCQILSGASWFLAAALILLGTGIVLLATFADRWGLRHGDGI